jgi:hypothetical protein
MHLKTWWKSKPPVANNWRSNQVVGRAPKWNKLAKNYWVSAYMLIQFLSNSNCEKHHHCSYINMIVQNTGYKYSIGRATVISGRLVLLTEPQNILWHEYNNNPKKQLIWYDIKTIGSPITKEKWKAKLHPAFLLIM